MSVLGATHSSLYDHVRGIVVGFVGFPESLAKYSCVSREYRQYIDTKGIPDQAISIPNCVVNKVFEFIHKFQALERLEMHGPSLFEPLVVKKGAEGIAMTGKINHLVFKNGTSRWQTAPPLIEFFNTMPVTALSLNEMPDRRKSTNSTSHQFFKWEWTPDYFRSGERCSLSPLGEKHLSQLTELNLIGSGMRHDLILQIVKHSICFKSVNLCQEVNSNQIFRALILSPNLGHLHLGRLSGGHSWAGEEKMDDAILTGCHSLQSFCASPSMTVEALIGVMQANRGVTHLDLSHCIGEILTAEVLQAIQTYLPGLLSLRVSFNQDDFPIAEFTSFLRVCVHLRSLSLQSVRGISVEMIALLKKSAELKELTIHHSGLSDPVFGALSTLTQLTSLNFISIWEGSAAGLLQIQTLVNLRSLTLNKVILVHDAMIGVFVNQLTKLEELFLIECQPDPRYGFDLGNNLSIDSLNFIRSAITAGRSPLKRLACTDNEIGLTPELRAQLKVELPQLTIDE